jgi:hypothetical protein
MVLLTTTPEYILEEKSINNKVLDAFDSLDKQKNATAKSCKTLLIDDSKKGEWTVKVLFDWKLEPTGSSEHEKPGDLEVVVKWRRKQGLEYEILDCIIYDSND